MAKLLEQPFFRNTVMWGILHFVAISMMSGLLYLVIHISPRAGGSVLVGVAVAWLIDLRHRRTVG
jgi:uncharacterized membrane protein